LLGRRACANGGLHYTALHCNTLQHAATHYCLGHPRRLIEPVQGDFIHSMQHVIEDENVKPDFDLGQRKFVVPFCRIRDALAMRSRYHTYLCTFLQGGEDLQEALSS